MIIAAFYNIFSSTIITNLKLSVKTSYQTNPFVMAKEFAKQNFDSLIYIQKN